MKRTTARAYRCRRRTVAPRRAHLLQALLACTQLLCVTGAIAAGPAPASIVDLQAYRQASDLAIDDEQGRGTVTLTNLNPHINRWFLLRVARDTGPGVVYHLDNPAPKHQKLALAPASGSGQLVIQLANGETHDCTLWSARPATELEQARRSGLTYAPLCDGRLYLRNAATGYRTTRELVTEVLRDRIWGGEKIIGLVRDRLLRDAQLEVAQAQSTQVSPAAPATAGPLQALIKSSEPGGRSVPPGLGIELDLPPGGGVAFGSWYRARLVPDIFVSMLQANVIDSGLLSSYPERVRSLDAVEASALVYLAALDLDRFELGFEMGTDHPRIGWSERSLPGVRVAGLPGPDGIDSAAPAITTGLVHPVDMLRTVATFTGGFKRSHGAFRYGNLAQVNHGSHYGFMQHGVVFSSLQPGLATVLVMNDSSVNIKTWLDEDRQMLPRIAHARQNGVPILQVDPVSGATLPGALVGNWGSGNWSGSKDGQLRTVRAGLCLQTSVAGRYLVYAYFSSVTPSAMARVFQAYRCQAAMQLDMNALEHTYFAMYGMDQTGVSVQHLVRGMEEVDKTVKGQSVPRFIGYPDNRDFFVVLRRQEVEP